MLPKGLLLTLGALGVLGACAGPPVDEVDDGTFGSTANVNGPTSLPDVIRAEHLVSFDTGKARCTVTTTLTFDLAVPSAPLFALRKEDMSATPTAAVAALLHGAVVDGADLGRRGLVVRMDPDDAQPWVSLAKPLARGRHRVAVTYAPPKSCFNDGRGHFEFLTFSRESLGFLETMLLSPNVGDVAAQSITFSPQRGSALDDHAFMTNGRVERRGDGVTVTFPDGLDVTGPFLDVIPKGRLRSREGTFTSSDGRVIPLTVYNDYFTAEARDSYPEADELANLDGVIVEVKDDLKKLEALLGPFPQPALVAAVGGGLMEFAGAVRTPNRHELIHQWLGRSATPAATRDFWIDEAMTEYLTVATREPVTIEPLTKHELGVAACKSRYESIDRRLYANTELEDGGYDAAQVLRELEGLVGRDRVVGMLREFHHDFRLRAYRTRDFAERLERLWPADAPLPFRSWFGTLPDCD